MKVVLAGLLLAACLGCGDDGRTGEEFAVYHLEAALGPPGETGKLRCGPERTACPGVVAQPPPRTFRYAVHAAPAVTSDGIDRSTVQRGSDSQTGAPFVTVALTPEGSEGFARVTRTAARTGARDQGWHHVAVVVGDEIVAFPEVDFDAYPDGIPDAPGIQIAATSDADARELVRRLRGE
jgi:hypothetical protein